MKTILKYASVLLIAFTAIAFTNDNNSTTPVKCMIQMKNYSGEGAYVVVSLINEDQQYKKTLYVHGKDPEWYSEIYSWWKFYGKRRTSLDAISGATISGGERSMSVLEIPSEMINAGYKLRFETAVEDKAYYETDLEIDLVEDQLTTKIEGTGRIRYVRLMPQQQ